MAVQPVSGVLAGRGFGAGEQGNGPSHSTAETGRENSPKAVIYEKFKIFDTNNMFDTVGAGCRNRAIIPAPPSVALQEPRS